MHHYDQLQELLATLDNNNATVEDMMAPHVDLESMAHVAQRRAAIVISRYASGAQITERALHLMVGSAFMDGFALGCAWTNLRKGSAER